MKATAPTYKNIYIIGIVLWFIYAALSLMAPLSPGSARFHLDTVELQVIRLTILIPMLGIWLLALYGAIRFKRYANSIQESSDGKALGCIANGVSWFVVYLIFLTMAGAILPYFHQSEYINWLISSRNILVMLAALTGFIYIFRGTLMLGHLIKAKTLWTTKRVILLLIPYCLFAIAFTYAFFLNPDLYHVGESLAIPTYVLPPPVLLVVIVIPYLVMWLLGILSILNLRNYAQTISGIIYRKALSRLVRGMVGVVSMTIALQLFNVLMGTISKFTLGSFLLIIYLLILLIAFSYGSIASGARRLSKIEATS